MMYKDLYFFVRSWILRPTDIMPQQRERAQNAVTQTVFDRKLFVNQLGAMIKSMLSGWGWGWGGGALEKFKKI